MAEHSSANLDGLRQAPVVAQSLPVSTGSAHRFRRPLVWAILDSLVIIIAYMGVLSARVFVTRWDIIRALTFITLVVVPIAVTALYFQGAYRRLWSRTSGHGVTVIVSAFVIATAMVSLMNLLLTPRPLPTSVVALGSALALSGCVATRYRSRLVTGLVWRWRAVWNREFPEPETRVLVVGAGESGQTIAWRLKHRAPNRSRYRIVGFADDDPCKRGLYIENAPVLGNRHDIPRLVDEERIDLIVMAIHNISGPDFREILEYCERTKARIKVVPDMFALLSERNSGPLLREVQPEDILGRKLVTRHEGVDLGPVTGKVVLVTGAAGSIGSELCRQLLAYQPAALILLDNNESGLHDMMTELSGHARQTRLVPVLADVAGWESIVAVFRAHMPQVIFHAAAYKHVPMLEWFPSQAVRVNIAGTWNLARAAQAFGVERFVLISTDKAVHPMGVMGASKRIGELIMRAMAFEEGHRTRFTAVRFGNVLGSRGSVVPTFNRQIDNGGPVTVTDPRMTRYFMSISEAVNLVIHAACLTEGGDLFMLKMGEEVRIVEMAERMIRMRGLRPYEDIEIQFTGVRPGEKLREELRSDSEEEIETVHPQIVKLVSAADGFQPDAFLAQLENMVCAPPVDSVELRQQMLDLATNFDHCTAQHGRRLQVAADWTPIPRNMVHLPPVT